MFSEVVLLCKEQGKTIATMESCTGGGVANAITNIAGSSDIFNFGAVTYSNEYKIKFGVPKEIIDTYTVYSKETARAMAKAIVEFTGATIGIGITGKLKRADENNLFGQDDIVYVSIFDKQNDKFYDKEHKVVFDLREENKKDVLRIVSNMSVEILKG